jgi:hypothetical protein
MKLHKKDENLIKELKRVKKLQKKLYTKHILHDEDELGDWDE